MYFSVVNKPYLDIVHEDCEQRISPQCIKDSCVVISTLWSNIQWHYHKLFQIPLASRIILTLAPVIVGFSLSIALLKLDRSILGANLAAANVYRYGRWIVAAGSALAAMEYLWMSPHIGQKTGNFLDNVVKDLTTPCIEQAQEFFSKPLWDQLQWLAIPLIMGIWTRYVNGLFMTLQFMHIALPMYVAASTFTYIYFNL